MRDDQAKEAAHSDELREPVKTSPKRVQARDGRGNAIDEPPLPSDQQDEGGDAGETSERGEPGVRKSSS